MKQRLSKVQFLCALLFLAVLSCLLSSHTLRSSDTQVYARLLLTDYTTNGTTTKAILRIRFFSDAQGTVPYSVSNLDVTYQKKRYNCITGNSSGISTITPTCNGTEYTFTVPVSQEDGIHCWTWDYLLQPGSGYIVLE